MAKPDWNKIRAEYEAKGTPYRKLATKYDVSFNTLGKRATREGWVQNGDNLNEKVATAVRQKVADRRATRIVDAIDPALEATQLLNDLVLKTLRDPDQFNRYIVETETRKPTVETLTTAGGKITQKIAYETEKHSEEALFDRVDTQRINQLTAALKASTELQRLLLGVLTAGDTERLKLQREALELEKEKAKKGDLDGKSVTVVWGEGTEGLAD